MPVEPIPRFSDEPPRQGIPFAEFYDEVRRGKREFVLPDGGTATVETLTPPAIADIIERNRQAAADVAKPEVAPLSLRDAILTAGVPRATVITVPTWGGVQVEVRALDGERYATWIERVVTAAGTPAEPDAATIFALAVVLGAHDPRTHAPVFTLDDVERVRKLDTVGLVQVALELHRLFPLPGIKMDGAAG